MLTEWKGCYKRGWGRELVPEAFAHPAKVSFSLAERIYAHMAAEGWIEPGMTVVDPFGGIGGFGYHALKHGLHFVGVELEPKFVDLAAQNIASWNRRYAGRFARWGTARVIQGDSRRLADVVREAGGVVSSPPFAGVMPTEGDPNYAWKFHGEQDSYGSTLGNLGNLRATDAGFSAVVSSPPYADGGTHQIEQDADIRELSDWRTDKSGGRMGTSQAAGYGTTPGQLAAMRADGFDSAVSSPPYESSVNSGLSGIDWDKANRNHADGHPRISLKSPAKDYEFRYGQPDGQLGSSSGDDFWHAARAIIEQTYLALRPGGVAVWIVKSFVRAGALVDFPGQWRQLCEACGFVTLHEHRALLVRDDGTQLAMDGNHKSHRRERKSFFRRLAEFNAQAAEFWKIIDDRAVKARYIREAHRVLWEQYHADLIDLKEDEEAAYPTRTRIMSSARNSAYRDAGAPLMDIDIRIDYETIYCMVKEA